MANEQYGRILDGDIEVIKASFDEFSQQPVDQQMFSENGDGFSPNLTTIAKPVSVTGPGTFLGKAQRTLRLEPCDRRGWWFERTDLVDDMPIPVSVNAVWTTVRNIVLRSGSPHNYMRMVEHIIALKLGMGIDSLMISMDSGDPPLFDRGSMDLVEALEDAGTLALDKKAAYLTVKEPVSMVGPGGSFLTFLPAENNKRSLSVDCAINFSNAIGKQRIQFDVTAKSFRHGALARTNTTSLMMLYCKTIGKIFADTRNLGYTTKNILVAGKKQYVNEPYLMHEGKSLEAVWHRACLDLLAAVALTNRTRFAGKILSYKAGHSLDVKMMRRLHKLDLLEVVEI
ncbi:hypothetical protein BVX94_01750 [bacterium B17]|nr:hypothetical protein BVX94_01750 [bacterium B17]